MNAPATIPAPRRIDVYLPAIDAFLSGCTAEEREQRAALMLMRDIAGRRIRTACDEAAAVLHSVQQIATAHCFAPMPIDDLKTLRYNLLRLVGTATNLQSLFGGRGESD